MVAELRQSDAAKNRLNSRTIFSEGRSWEIYESWNGQRGWRSMFRLTAVPSLLFLVLMFVVLESPRWLAKNGESALAQSVLARIGGAAYAKRAIDEIEATLGNKVEKG